MVIPASCTDGSSKVNRTIEKNRLCWTRRDLVRATGLSPRSIRNLEQRGLLVRVPVGLNVACYSDASVRALFAEKAAPGKEAA
jgi:hypothetical protein